MAAKEEAAQAPAALWLLAFGSLEDNQPTLALALALQGAGHRVKVFGLGVFRRLFVDYGLEFEAFDGPIVRHPGNTEARSKLRKLAGRAGFEGSFVEEDYLFDVLLLWFETLCRKTAEHVANGVDLEEAGEKVKLEGEQQWCLLERGIGVEQLQDVRRSCLRYLAAAAGQTAESYDAQAGKRREAFRHFVKLKAAELMRHPVDLLVSFTKAFKTRLTVLAKLLGDDQAQVADMVAYESHMVCAWQTEEEFDLIEYWESQYGSRSGKEGVDLASESMASFPLFTLNMLATFEAARIEDRPRLVIYSSALAGTALALKTKHGASTLLLGAHLPIVSEQGRIESFSNHLQREDSLGVAPRPFHERGPWDLLEQLGGERLIIGMSSLAVRNEDFGGDEGSRQRLTACCTGELALDWQLPANGSSAQIFGTDEEQQQIETFLEEGDEPPVCVSFGSMCALAPGPEFLAARVVQALASVGRRGIFVAGWSGVTQEMWMRIIAEEFPDEGLRQLAEAGLLWVPAAPLDILLPHCACLVHHGGAASCSAALRAGVPSVVVPFGFDQPRHGQWLESLGCGVVRGPFAELKTDELASGLTSVLESKVMQAVAQLLAPVVRAEDGPKAAVAIVERCLLEPEAPLEKGSPSLPLDCGLYASFAPDGALLPVGLMEIGGGGGVWRLDGDYFAWARPAATQRGDQHFEFQACIARLGVIAHFNVDGDGRTVTFEDGNQLCYEKSVSMFDFSFDWRKWYELAYWLVPLLMLLSLAVLMAVKPRGFDTPY